MNYPAHPITFTQLSFGFVTSMLAAFGVVSCAEVKSVSADIATACQIYENPMAQLGLNVGLSFLPDASAVKAAIDPWVTPICNGSIAGDAAFVLLQAGKVQQAINQAPKLLAPK